MKLYYATGTCSLFPHIVANEVGLPLDLERVDIARTPHVTEDGSDYGAVNPKGYVPALRLDDGAILTEGIAIALYLAELKPERGLAPAPGTRERAALQSWLTFVATELHKLYSPWLFHPDYGAQAQDVARRKIGERLAFVERHLAGGGPFLLGEGFTAADAYLFTIVGWSAYTKIDLSGFPQVRAFLDRVGARPAVRAARLAEGLEETAA
ncbi:glutathione binding-like protein [Methylobacterium sp. J-072]|uniref:glutathione binding-like protein n=1 Tax=Methylobacterium sp. J-072 TaxID=2836651 RepID=UPI001FBBA1F5|nr:glutathione binding-like protein [Methylobacterium sp. J-072]MCJ2095244.1 glutathione binding-like protein [Methylobacterium sp. J-072]